MVETKKDGKKNIDTPVGEPLKTDKVKSNNKNSTLFYILTIITALLLVTLIIGGAFFYVIKINMNGIAVNMKDSIEKIPVLRLALPKKPEPEDEKNMSEKQVRNKYTQLNEEKVALEKQISDLNSQVDETNKQLSAKDTNSTLLQQQKDALEKEMHKLTTENTTLKKDFADVSAVIAKGDKTEFSKYFEKINPEIAAELYEKLLLDKKMSDDVKDYCSIYESMDASAVADVMEQMGTGKMTLIVEIMKNLKKETAGEILTEMTPVFAAKLTEQLAKVYNVETVK